MKPSYEIAIIHDYLIQMGGAERVVEVLHNMFPQAPLYTSAVQREGLLPGLRDADIRTSVLRWLPAFPRYFKAAFPLYPMAFRWMPVNANVAIVSSSGFSKWVRLSPQTRSICYCYTPPRFFWMRDRYLEFEVNSSLLKRILNMILEVLRKWDYQQAQQMDEMVAISKCVQQRIQDCYGRQSRVIYPPVDVERFTPTCEHDGFYLIVSRLVGYKQIGRAVEAFNRNGKKLVIVGRGPDQSRLQHMAGANIIFEGGLSDPEVIDRMQRCYAVIFPGLEDFGIVPVEANACGKPVVAFAGGGALETIVDGKTGVFYQEPSVDSLVEAVERAEQLIWDVPTIRRQAETFSEQRFIREFRQLVEQVQAPQ